MLPEPQLCRWINDGTQDCRRIKTKLLFPVRLKNEINRIIIFKCIVVRLFCWLPDRSIMARCLQLVTAQVRLGDSDSIVSLCDCENAWQYTKFSELFRFFCFILKPPPPSCHPQALACRLLNVMSVDDCYCLSRLSNSVPRSDVTSESKTWCWCCDCGCYLSSGLLNRDFFECPATPHGLSSSYDLQEIRLLTASHS